MSEHENLVRLKKLEASLESAELLEAKEDSKAPKSKESKARLKPAKIEAELEN